MNGSIAQITDIQRFSLSDGPGIRTTVFFKGCNMRCSWCHNPETISSKQQIHFYPNKCIGCGECFKACPCGAHIIQDDVHIIDRTECTGCGACAEVCYAEALTLSGKTMNVEDIMKELVQDIPYYNESKGGVTLSGGEVLCQREFALALINECKKNGIHTAIETNLHFDFNEIKDVLENVDLIMCDLKIFDNDKHIKYTGVSNEKIKRNISEIEQLGIPFIVRTPLIPEVTDDRDNIVSIAGYLKGFENMIRYEVLNFNPLGEAKYKSLDMKNDFEKARPLKSDCLHNISSWLDEMGISYKIV